MSEHRYCKNCRRETHHEYMGDIWDDEPSSSVFERLLFLSSTPQGDRVEGDWLKCSTCDVLSPPEQKVQHRMLGYPPH